MTPRTTDECLCDLAVLVVKRKGSGHARDWYAYVRVDELLWTVSALEVALPTVVSMPLGRLLRLLAVAVAG